MSSQHAKGWIEGYLEALEGVEGMLRAVLENLEETPCPEEVRPIVDSNRNLVTILMRGVGDTRSGMVDIVRQGISRE